MTSQRFLNDKASKKDFLRSLGKIWVFPVIAFVVLCNQFLAPTIYFITEKKSSLEGIEWLKSNHVISYFGVPEWSSEMLSLMTVGMLICGMLIAISQFSFAFKKNSVNVYFSMGITRTRLYLNRIFAGILELLVATFLPFFITFLVNVSVFGFHKHQIAVMFYYSFVLFVSGVIGLAITSFVSAVSGSIAEAVLTSFTMSTTPMILISQIAYLKPYLLKGFVEIEALSKTNLLDIVSTIASPWNIAENIGKVSDSHYLHSPFQYMGELLIGDKVPKDTVLDAGLLVPILAWVVISAVVFCLGLYLFNKRKTENANSIGKFSVSSAINGAFIFTLVSTSDIFVNWYDSNEKFVGHNGFVCLTLFLIASFVAFFLAELLLRRKVKAVKKILPVWVALAVFSVAVTVFIGTGHFGTFNKVPEAKDVESVSMTIDDPRGVFDYSALTAYDNNILYKSDFIESKDKKDIDICLGIYNLAKSGKYYDSNSKEQYIDFVIKLKNGDVIARRFKIYSDDLAREYTMDLFDSNFYDLVLKEALRTDKTQSDEESYDYYRGEGFFDYGASYDAPDAVTYLNGTLLRYFDATGLCDGEKIISHDEEGIMEEQNYSNEEFIVEAKLLKALYNDLSKMSYMDLFNNSEKPVGMLALGTDSTHSIKETYEFQGNYVNWHESEFAPWETLKVGESITEQKTYEAYNCIYIYPQMTETLKALGKETPAKSTAKPKKVMVAQNGMSVKNMVMSVENMVRQHIEYQLYGNATSISVFNMAHTEFSIDEIWNASRLKNEQSKGNYVDFIEMLYRHYGAKTKTVTDSKKVEKIVDAALPIYDTFNDDGAFVIITYDNGAVVERYIPGSAISVIK